MTIEIQTCSISDSQTIGDVDKLRSKGIRCPSVRHATLALAGLVLAATTALAQIDDNELIYGRGGDGTIAASLDLRFTMVRPNVASSPSVTVSNISNVLNASRKVMMPIHGRWTGHGPDECPAMDVVANQGQPGNPLTIFKDDLDYIDSELGDDAIHAFFYNLEYRPEDEGGHFPTCQWGNSMSPQWWADQYTALVKAYKEIVEDSAFSDAELWVYSNYPTGDEKLMFGVDWDALSHGTHAIDGGMTLNPLTIGQYYTDHDNQAEHRSDVLKAELPGSDMFVFAIHEYPPEWNYFQHEPLVKQTLRNNYHCSDRQGALFYYFKPSVAGETEVRDWTTEVVDEQHDPGNKCGDIY